MSKDKTKMVDFLEEYTKLCKKYDVYIYGCGCCDSPCLMELENDPYQPDPTATEILKNHIEHLAGTI